MKTIILYCDAAGPRQWLLTARERLGAAGHRVVLARGVGGGREGSAGNLLRACEWIDGAINSNGGGGLSVRIAGAAAAAFVERPEAAAGASVEVHGDDGVQPTWQRLQILYDGAPGDEALFGALLEGRVPQIEIVDIESGAALVAGVASLEASRSLMGRGMRSMRGC